MAVKGGIMKTKRLLWSVPLSALILSGCYKQPGLVKDDSYNRTKTGALIGAIAGAVAGYNKGGSKKKEKAAIGAVLGAAAGGGIGYMLDKQANEVAEALGTGVENDPLAALDPRRDVIVTKHPGYVKILFRDKMMFPFGSAKLRPEAEAKVMRVARLLQNYPQTIVGVAGFTDNIGSYAYNKKLSEARAQTVANLLTVHNRPLIKGCAYEKPIAPNDTKENRALNRRVEVYLFADNSKVVDPCIH